MKWAIVGAGAQGRVILDIHRAGGRDEEYVFVDDNAELHGQRICDVEVASRAVLEGVAGNIQHCPQQCALIAPDQAFILSMAAIQ